MSLSRSIPAGGQFTEMEIPDGDETAENQRTVRNPVRIEADEQRGTTAPASISIRGAMPTQPVKRSAPDAVAIRQRIERIYSEKSMLDADGTSREILPSAVTAERGAFIAEVCRAERPASTLEVGFGYGLSTLHVLAALAEVRGADEFLPHVLIDPHEASRYGNAGLRALRELGADQMVEFYAEPSEIVLPRMMASRRRFDLVFIDGDHRFDGGFVDFFFVDRLLRPGGVLILDDVIFDGIYLTSHWAETNLGYQPIAQYPATGSRPRRSDVGKLQRAQIAAWRKPLKNLERDRFHFVPFFDGFVPMMKIPKPDPRRVERNCLSHGGLVALQAGDRAGARRAFTAAVRLDPLYMTSYLRWMRTLLPRRLAAALTGRTRS